MSAFLDSFMYKLNQVNTHNLKSDFHLQENNEQKLVIYHSPGSMEVTTFPKAKCTVRVNETDNN